jgi:type I restriction enzyme S subunit
LANLVFALPPLAEQREIVRSINAKIPGIDAAISRTGNAIILLREYRARLIADVVTGKLDVQAAAARLPAESEDVELLDSESGVPETESEEEAESENSILEEDPG